MKKDDVITMMHGNGGKQTYDLVENLFLKVFNNQYLLPLADAALCKIGNTRVAFTTDSYVVKPIFFPGGDIGKLAVCGTVNDLAVMGANPLYLSSAFIIEEGFPLYELEKIIQSMQCEAQKAGVMLITGDTKVVEKGSVDGLFVNTAGIGMITNSQINLSESNITPGDNVIISGTIGDHGVAIISARQDFPIEINIKSDCASLNSLLMQIVNKVSPGEIKVMRDPTRGGIATTLNEFVMGSDFSIYINQDKIPIKDEVKAICEMTGFDPLYIANEGKVAIIATAKASPRIMEIMRTHPLGRNAAIIGRVEKEPQGRVILNTEIGGSRIIDMLVSQMLPRIC